FLSISFTCLHSLFSITTSPTAIYPLSLHDALPIYILHAIARQQLRKAFCDSAHDTGSLIDQRGEQLHQRSTQADFGIGILSGGQDRKSTRLNSSHQIISYAVFCLKKKKKKSQRYNQ